MNTLRGVRTGLIVLAGFVGTTSGSAEAGLLTTSLPYGDFGHVSNQGGRCAATAQINSFGFLANTYHNTYDGTHLTTGSSTSMSEAAVELDTLMGGGGCGVTSMQAWNGKINWFDLYAPDTTKFEGRTPDVTHNFTDWLDREDVAPVLPDGLFLLSSLLSKADVEIRLAEAHHWVTLTAITYNTDTHGAESISYIDPNCVLGTDATNPGPITVPATENAHGIHFGWRNGNGSVCSTNNPVTQTAITAAFVESPRPVSEPRSVAIFSTGLFTWAILTCCWKHRRFRAGT